MSVRIIHGDCRDALRTLPDASVHCCVTSPPYWGLRDYGTAKWEGGDAACDHSVSSGGPSQLEGASQRGRSDVARGACPRCGATRIDAQLGLESSPAKYVARMVEVFREVRRVLRDDGTLWLNLGDSYATGAGKASSPGGGAQGERFLESGPSGYRGGHDLSPKHSRSQVPDGKNPDAMIPTYQPNRMPIAGLKPKDLVGIPWRVAFALQADGWYLRQDIIWAKPNPMPESVRDRRTKAHEYIFLLSKSERYYYGIDAIREPHTTEGAEKNTGQWEDTENVKHGDDPKFQTRPGTRPADYFGHALGRNKRSVWTVATQPFSEAHFATFPPKLIEPCVLAGCPAGGTVLDPFGGAGTTGLVADRHGRDAILIELNPDYAAMAEKRIHADGPLFAEVSA